MSEWLWPLQKLVNDALRYDLTASEKLTALTGKTLVLNVTEPNMSISLTVEHDGFVFLQSGMIEPFDAQVSGKATDLFAVLRSEDRTAAMMAHEINIQGDTRTFFAIQEVMSHLDVDWEMALADKMGDLTAHVVADGLRFFGQMARNHFDSFQRTSRNFFREESGLFVQDSLWQLHTQNVARVKQDAERVAAKLKKLEQQLNARDAERDS
jgi:ubiquinone biosynthesis protein UbiJ